MDIWEKIRIALRDKKTSYEYLNNIGEAMKMYPEFNSDSLSKGQLYSKLWLVDELKKISPYYGTVFLLGGWYGMLAEMLFENMVIDKIRSYDLDETACKIADEINVNYIINNWKFKAFVADINKLDYSDADTIINTSTEHIDEDTWFNKIPANKLIIIQSNNLTSIEDHTNCVKTEFELMERYNLSKYYFRGELDLVDYKRFMIIGRK